MHPSYFSLFSFSGGGAMRGVEQEFFLKAAKEEARRIAKEEADKAAAIPAQVSKAPAPVVTSASAPQASAAAPILFEGTGAQAQNLLIYIILCFTIIGIPFALIPYLRVAFTKYKISTARLEIESGIFSKSIENVLLIRAKDIKYEQSFSDTLFGLGTIRVISDDVTAGCLVFKSIPNAKPVYERLSTQMEAVAARHGVVHY
jgi:hypothetical protein